MKLSQIKEMLSKISSWPWSIDPEVNIIFNKTRSGTIPQASIYEKNNIFFIASAPTIIDQLIRQNEVMREALEEVIIIPYKDSDINSLLETLRCRSQEALKEVERIEDEK